MTDNFQRYVQGQDDIEPENERHTGPQVFIRDTVTKVSTIDGIVTETAQGIERGSHAELNPWHGTDSFAATARNPNGAPATELLPNTLVTINGLQGTVAFFVAEGYLQKGPDGTYTEGPGNAPQVAADTSDILPISPAAMDQINQALEPVPQADLEGLIGIGMGTAVGRLDGAALVHKFAQASGCDLAESGERMAVIRSAYQSQANEALTARNGIDAADIPAFWEWAKANCQGQLQEAVQLQLRNHDVSGYRVIAQRWMSANPPSMAAMKAAGLHVRDRGEGQQVFVQGSWMTPSAAARAGLL